MNKKSIKTIRTFSIPVVYVIATAFYWNYALYRGLTTLEFAIFLTISTILFTGVWAYLNKSLVKKALMSAITFATILVIVQIVIFSFFISIPGGWGNLN